MKAVAILLVLIALASEGCKGERVPKPKTDAPAVQQYTPGMGSFQVV